MKVSTKLTLLFVAHKFLCLTTTIATEAPTASYNDDPNEDDTVNLRAVGGYFTSEADAVVPPRCVFPFEFNGKLHNGCLNPSEISPFLSDKDDSSALPPPPGTAQTTGDILGWCPHNYERVLNAGTTQEKVLQFRSFDEYDTTGTMKKMWGYCQCEGGFFWQRIPTTGIILEETCHIGTVTDLKANLWSKDCRQICDETPSCQAFEFAKFALKNTCRIFKCVAPSSKNTTITEFFGEALDNTRYKQQIKRPCEEATVDFTGTPIFNERNVTLFPTAFPTPLPTISSPPNASPTEPEYEPEYEPVTSGPTPSPTPFPTSFPTFSPVARLPATTSPTGNKNIGGDSNEDENNNKGSISPAAIVVPFILVVLSLILIAGVIKKRNEDRNNSPDIEESINEDIVNETTRVNNNDNSGNSAQRTVSQEKVGNEQRSENPMVTVNIDAIEKEEQTQVAIV